jgi:hypothetical protein
MTAPKANLFWKTDNLSAYSKFPCDLWRPGWRLLKSGQILSLQSSRGGWSLKKSYFAQPWGDARRGRGRPVV